MYYAHTAKDRDWEPLREHLVETADRAEGFASAFHSGPLARHAGLWHDLGKYSEAFQAYLKLSASLGDEVHQSDLRGTVDHSTAGAQHAAKHGPVGRLLAYCIAGHHAGLPDGEGETVSCLRGRLGKVIEPIEAAPADLKELGRLPIRPLQTKHDREKPFALAFYTRMLFSCLVDADFLATEKYLDPDRSEHRVDGATCNQLRERLDRYLAEKVNDATHVNRRRAEVLDACRAKASQPPGFFSLNVPTGGGKTLSSLAFALRHAEEHDLRRVVYAIPFTSIIEQTADVFREALGDEVLEHHSSLEPDDPARQTVRSRLAAENFDASLIVTTNVQLFESLFASRTSRCRKLHRLAKSVIILDEAQTLPPKLLAPTLAALRELVVNYGSTVVLCTATQPAIEHRESFPIGLECVRPIIDDPHALHRDLRRTSVEMAGELTVEELAARLEEEKQALCIVNSRRHAAAIFQALDDPNALHLSASMCAAHRSEVVREIRRRLSRCPDEPCLVVSTQVIEAGVDVDFPTVYRAAAGLDSIAQAAGRCNREGKLTGPDDLARLGRVVVFDYDAKSFRTVPLIERAACRFHEVAPDHANDLLAPEAIEAYFGLHYWNIGGDLGQGWDKGAEDRSVMECFSLDRSVGLRAQFREASSAYRLIDDAQTPILVPFGEQGKHLIERLESLPEAPDPKDLRAFDRRAQRYTVGVFDRDLWKLDQNHVLLERHGRFYLGNPGAYNEQLGLDYKVLGLDAEALVI
ncbi:CRISPR-associated helicase Cas3' [Paludisphaera rhizosphaerae]|uniref:CRISPR-associated helicase Cas3' n=1 Tax=Paludisphaera rhizosphaerae TaxID=2711216 RepID=UPI0013EC9439|nr:CRISPR-associated helicase Cas3' [Paludisphaera rhizosphaerae]